MTQKKEKPEQQNINVTIHGDVIGSNLTAGNENQSAINSILSAKQNPLPIYQNDSDVHPVGDLPLSSHLPFSPNALFTGREKELKKLADSILGESKTNTVITQAVTGMGGLGKTQLAIEFGYRYGKYFRGVHWINVADPTQLNSEIANCGRQMFSQDFPEDQPTQVALTLKTWKENGPNLLILDNFEEPSKASDILTKLRHSNICILVTSRRTDWSQTLGLTQLPLDLFSEEESLQFLKDSLKDRKDSKDDLKGLAERLGHLPLGLELASRYLSGHARLSISEYLKQTENALDHVSMKNWQADMPAATGHDLDLQKTFALSWGEVEEETAQKMFMSAGYLAPNTSIPLEIFEVSLGIESEKCDGSLSLLYGLGLFRKGEDNLPTIHPLLSEYAQSLAKENKEILETLAETLVDLSYKANDTGLLANFFPIRPHIPVLAAHAEDAKLIKVGTLWNNLSYHLREIADYAGATAIYERALKLDEINFGESHPHVATSVNNLADIYYKLGSLKNAKKMFERALKIDEASFGEHHLNVARDVNNLGNVLYDLGDLKGAIIMLERAIKIWEENFGSEHPHVAVGINNLGDILRESGDLHTAKSMFERMLRILEKNLPAEHPQLAAGVNNLGLVMQGLGDLNGAKEMFERALKIWEANFGSDHPNVAIGVNNLAGVYFALGDSKSAKLMYERSLEIERKFLPSNHPSIKKTEHNLKVLNESKLSKI